MLIPLGSGARADDGGDAVDRLLACHARIRRFTALAARLVEPAPAAEVAEAAAAVHRYFTVALPLHVADEEHSLAPRLPSLPELAAMTAEHRAIESLLADLAGHWSEVAAAPARAAALARPLADGASALARHFDAHLPPEESAIFPAVRRLPPAAQRAIVDEMLARRR